MEKHKARLQEIQSVLDANPIDVNRLKKCCANGGCPNEGGMRSLLWKIFLNVVPRDKTQWKPVMENRRNNYKQFVRDIIIRPGCASEANEAVEAAIDHPLNSSPNSEWASYFKDNETLVQIDKDVRRLCPDLFFFQKPTEYPCEEIKNVNSSSSKYESLRKRVAKTQLQADEVCKNRLGITSLVQRSTGTTYSSAFDEQSEYSHLPDGQEAHWEIVERILFIFAKLNPGQSYVQGMNEICGPLYYTFATDPDPEWRAHAEADCFFCFTNLMGVDGVRDNFVQILDDTEWGIGSNMKRLYALVKRNDPAVFQVLEKQQLKPEFFAFRWLTLLLSQEFELPDVIAIWDSLFSDSDLFDLLLHICCAMIVLQHDHLLANEFSSNIKQLQNYPSIDIQVLINKARSLRN